MPPRDEDQLRLSHMRDYSREVRQFTEGVSAADLETDIKLLRALTYSIGIIGEAATHISDEFREAHPDIPWRQIVGMRNFLFHDYAGISNAILWDTATIEIPKLLKQLDAILPDND